jgi:NAD+ kinase
MARSDQMRTSLATGALPAGQNHHVGDVVLARRVVVVRKTSQVEQLQHRPDRKLEQAMAAGDPLAVRVMQAHLEHRRTADEVESVLRARGVEHVVVPRFGRRLARWADLVVTVGGDGTFLRASHSIDAGQDDDGTPMLAVNSATSSSIGYFAAATESNFAHLFDEIQAGRVRSRGLWRARVAVNGRLLRDLALNDVLVAHRSPAETSRYTLCLGGREQEQKSSGIWLATAAGSTAAIRSAGGLLLDIDARALQYRVRELMQWAVLGEPLIGGLVEGPLEVVSRMTSGALYIDGGHLRVTFGFGDRIVFTPADRPMPWVAPDWLPAPRTEP